MFFSLKFGQISSVRSNHCLLHPFSITQICYSCFPVHLKIKKAELAIPRYKISEKLKLCMLNKLKWLSFFFKKYMKSRRNFNAIVMIYFEFNCSIYINIGNWLWTKLVYLLLHLTINFMSLIRSPVNYFHNFLPHMIIGRADIWNEQNPNIFKLVLVKMLWHNIFQHRAKESILKEHFG